MNRLEYAYALRALFIRVEKMGNAILGKDFRNNNGCMRQEKLPALRKGSFDERRVYHNAVTCSLMHPVKFSKSPNHDCEV